MNLSEKIHKWRRDAGLSIIKFDEENKAPVQFAMEFHIDDEDVNAIKLDEVITILSNYLIFLASEMGRIFARVRYLEESRGGSKLTLERAKLNMIKPVHDAVKVKIDVLKKIYDRKIREAWNASSDRG